VSLREVAGHDELLALTGDDPWVRLGLDPGALPPVWHDPDAGLVAVLRDRRGPGRSLMLLPKAGADAVRALAEARPLLAGAHWVTVPAEHRGAAVAALSLVGDGEGWEWRYATRPPPAVRGDACVADLDINDPVLAQQVSTLLTEHSPRHSARPGDPRAVGWVGVRAGPDGAPVACAAWFEEVPGIPLLASIAVHPSARGRGFGSAVTASLTRRAFAAGAPAVTIDLYADNDAARRIYRRLGFVTAHRFASWHTQAR
jgi:GNAT superfamily N-acetyltransferase